MYLYAILSDIHANYQALRAVSADARNIARLERLPLDFVCLGDVVNYGPQPNECTAWMRRQTRWAVQGRHDREAYSPLYQLPTSVARPYWPVTLWTRVVLLMEHKLALKSWPKQQDGLPGLQDFHIKHGQLLRLPQGKHTIRAAQSHWEQLHTRYGLSQQHHFQGVFSVELDPLTQQAHVVKTLVCLADDQNTHSDSWQAMALDQTWHPLPGDGVPLVITPGSVGQPRQHRLLKQANCPPDWRAAYTLVKVDDAGQISLQFRRVSYDVTETIRLMRKYMNWSQTLQCTEPQLEDELQRVPVSLRRQAESLLNSIETTLESCVEDRLITALQGG